MTKRIERALAHLFGWHTPACHADRRCYRPGVVEINALGWHRRLADRRPA